MRTLVCLLCCLLGSSALAEESLQVASTGSVATRRDPTLPSSKISQRLNSGQAAAPMADGSTSPQAAPIPAALPPIRLRAIVMADQDHGAALLESGDQKLTVPLTRRPPGAASHATDAALLQNGFTVQGVFFSVKDFSDRMLLLRAGDRTMVIQ